MNRLYSWVAVLPAVGFVLLAGDRLWGQETVGKFPSELAAAFGPQFALEVEIPLMDAGLAEYRGVAARSAGLNIRSESVRPAANGRFSARGVRAEGVGLSPMTAESLHADLAVVARLLGAAPGNDVLGSGVCDEEVARKPLRLRVTDLAAGPNSVGESVSVGELVLELAALKRERSQPCRVGAKFDLTGFVRVGTSGSRLDARGLTVTVGDTLQPGLAEVIVNVAEARMTGSDGSEPAALGTGNVRMLIDRIWLRELVEGFLLQGRLPTVPELFAQWAPGGEFAELRAVAIDAEHVYGKKLARLYRLATGRRSVDFSARVTREREETGEHRIRLHLFGAGMLDAVFFARVRADRGIEVADADILYRDLGLAALLERMEAGSLEGLLQQRVRALAAGRMAAAAVEGLEDAVIGAGPWLERAREERMQVSFRPEEAVSMPILEQLLAGARQRMPEYLGLRHGPYVAR